MHFPQDNGNNRPDSEPRARPQRDNATASNEAPTTPEYAEPPTFAECRDHLDLLAGKVADFDREISLTRTGAPVLLVTNPDVPVLCEYVLCRHDGNGTLAYFWLWSRRIAAVTDPQAAADAVTHMLSSRKP